MIAMCKIVLILIDKGNGEHPLLRGNINGGGWLDHLGL